MSKAEIPVRENMEVGLIGGTSPFGGSHPGRRSQCGPIRDSEQQAMQSDRSETHPEVHKRREGFLAIRLSGGPQPDDWEPSDTSATDKLPGGVGIVFIHEAFPGEHRQGVAGEWRGKVHDAIQE